MMNDKTTKELASKILNKNATRKFYDVKETTYILQQYGLAHNEKKTRDLIRQQKLVARNKGTDPNDRRSGFEISEKAIYDFVTGEIPIIKDLYKMLEEKTNKINQK